MHALEKDNVVHSVEWYYAVWLPCSMITMQYDYHAVDSLKLLLSELHFLAFLTIGKVPHDRALYKHHLTPDFLRVASIRSHKLCKESWSRSSLWERDHHERWRKTTFYLQYCESLREVSKQRKMEEGSLHIQCQKKPLLMLTGGLGCRGVKRFTPGCHPSCWQLMRGSAWWQGAYSRL
jgi:hypothetical protein